jgi:hypothetical protein
MVSYAKLRYDFPERVPSVFLDEGVNLLLDAFSCGASGPTTTWLICDAMSVFPSLKCFTTF